MMLTEYWIFMLVWCFILGKLNALPVMYGKNLLKTYTWNTKNIHHNYKLNFPANALFLEMRLLSTRLQSIIIIIIVVISLLFCQN